MTRLAAPLIIAAHVEHLPTLPGWAADGDRPAVRVFEGAAITREDVREWLTVGYVAGDDDPSLTLEPVPNAQGTTREVGTITCQLFVAAADVPAARARVFDLAAAWSGWLVADRTLQGSSGAARLMAGSAAHLVLDVALGVTRGGAAAANARVTVTYTAVTYG